MPAPGAALCQYSSVPHHGGLTCQGAEHTLHEQYGVAARLSAALAPPAPLPPPLQAPFWRKQWCLSTLRTDRSSWRHVCSRRSTSCTRSVWQPCARIG